MRKINTSIASYQVCLRVRIPYTDKEIEPWGRGMRLVAWDVSLYAYVYSQLTCNKRFHKDVNKLTTCCCLIKTAIVFSKIPG